MVVLDSADPFAAFERGLRHPVSSLVTAGELTRNLLVVIDGLDEMSVGRRGNELIDMLAIQSLRPAPGLRFLITTRPGPVTDKLCSAPRLSLDDDPSTVDTISSVLESLAALRQRARRKIAKSAQGNFVYAMLAASSVDQSEPPPSLDDLYRLMVDADDAAAAQLLGAVCQARDNGLSPSALAGILGSTRRDVGKTLSKVRQVLEGSRIVRPHHRCLTDHIHSLAGEADGRIGSHLVDHWGGRWEECTDSYALRNVLPHLAGAIRSQPNVQGAAPDDTAATMLRETLTDPGYVTAALAALGVDELRTTLAYTGHRVAGTAADTDTLPALADIFHEQAWSLRRVRGGPAVNRQFVYLAATLGATELSRRLAGRTAPGDLETLWATDDNLAMRTAAQAIRGHRADVTALAVAANGTQAVSSSLDGTTLVWRLASGRLTNTLSTPAHVTNVHSGPDAGQVSAAFADGSAQQWDLTTGVGQRLPDTPTMRVTAIDAAHDAGRGVTGDLDYGVTVWSLETPPKPLLRLPPQAGRITAVALSADGKHVAAGCITGDITVWEVQEARVRMRLDHRRPVTAICLTRHGERVVVGDDESVTVHAVTDVADADAPATDTAVGGLGTRAAVTALAANPALPSDVILGTAAGQVAYIRVPFPAASRRVPP
jgi:hypothetical protein